MAEPDMVVEPATPGIQAEENMEHGCGAGCGCGSAEMEGESCGDGCGCGSGHASAFGEMETAAIQGFLSGLYASSLGREKLAEYFAAMAKQEGSEFQRPAQLLASALEALPEEDDSGKPVGIRLLELVSGESA